MIIFCKNCGSEIKNDAKFCGKCGNKIDENTSEASANIQTQYIFVNTINKKEFDSFDNCCVNSFINRLVNFSYL